jgi:SnoaL-like domain
MDKALPKALGGWHAVAASRDRAGLDELLADDVVFESPVVHTPQRGKALTTKYLTAAPEVLALEFRYVGQWIGETSGVLEFVAIVDGITINGVDMIGWDEEGRIVSFKVMVRPLKGMEVLRAKMAVALGFPAPESAKNR